MAIVIRPGIPNDRVDLIIILQCLVQRLKDQTARALTTGKTRDGAMVKSKGFPCLIEQTVRVINLYVSIHSIMACSCWLVSPYPIIDMVTKFSGCRRNLDPATRAESASPDRILCTAWWRA